jgi:hypothetical protein
VVLRELEDFLAEAHPHDASASETFSKKRTFE